MAGGFRKRSIEYVIKRVIDRTRAGAVSGRRRGRWSTLAFRMLCSTAPFGSLSPRLAWGLSVVLLAVPVGASLAAQQAPPVLIAPGDSSLHGSRIRADSVQYSLIAYRGAQQQTIGTAIDVVRREMRGDVPVIHRVLTVSPGRGLSRGSVGAITGRAAGPMRCFSDFIGVEILEGG